MSDSHNDDLYQEPEYVEAFRSIFKDIYQYERRVLDVPTSVVHPDCEQYVGQTVNVYHSGSHVIVRATLDDAHNSDVRHAIDRYGELMIRAVENIDTHSMLFKSMHMMEFSRSGDSNFDEGQTLGYYIPLQKTLEVSVYFGTDDLDAILRELEMVGLVFKHYVHEFIRQGAVSERDHLITRTVKECRAFINNAAAAFGEHFINNCDVRKIEGVTGEPEYKTSVYKDLKNIIHPYLLRCDVMAENTPYHVLSRDALILERADALGVALADNALGKEITPDHEAYEMFIGILNNYGEPSSVPADIASKSYKALSDHLV